MSGTRWGRPLLVFALGGCTTALPPQERTALVGHKAHALHYSLFGLAPPQVQTSGDSTFTEFSAFRVPELEGYYRYNLGLYGSWTILPRVRRDSGNDSDHTVERSHVALGPSYALPVSDHADLVFHLGAAFYSFAIKGKEYSGASVCVISNGSNSCEKTVTLADTGATGLDAEMRLVFHSYYFRPGIGLILNQTPDVSLPSYRSSFGSSVSPRPLPGGWTVGLMLHLLSFSTESR